MRGRDNKTRVTLAERGWSDRLHESVFYRSVLMLKAL